MLECRACLLRCLRALCHDAPSQSLKRPTRPAVRNYSSRAVQPRSESSLGFSRPRRNVRTDNSLIAAAKAPIVGGRTAPSNVTNTQLNRLKLELPWLGADRIKVLRRTKELLKEGRQAEALELVRLSSKNIECTIAWNAVLEDLMQQGKVNEAFKVYNDVRTYLLP